MTGKRPRGRPNSVESIGSEILRLRSEGVSLALAAVQAGCSLSSVDRWKNLGEQDAEKYPQYANFVAKLRAVEGGIRAKKQQGSPSRDTDRTSHLRHVLSCALLVDHATPEDLLLEGQELLDRALDAARSHLLPFTAHCYLGRMDEYRPAWFHTKIAAALDAWVKGYRGRLMISMPPQHGKTELGGRMLVSYILGRTPDLRVALGCYSEALASKTSREVKKVINSAAFKELFPTVRLPTQAEKLRGEAISQGIEWELISHKGGFRGAGIHGSISGFGASYVIIDDILKGRKAADSETNRNLAWESFQEDWSSRQNWPDCIAMIGTRWHTDDPMGRTVAKMATDETADRYEVINLPAILEDESDRTKGDPRELGAPLWPEGRLGPWERDISEAVLVERALKLYRQQMAATPGGVALYQGRPVRREGERIKRAWLQRRFSILPEKLELWAWVDCKSPKLQVAQGSRTSYAAIGMVGLSGGEFFVADESRGRWGVTETAMAVRTILARWPKAKGAHFEDAAAANAVIEQLSRSFTDASGKVWPAIICKKTKVSVDKAERFDAVEHHLSGVQSMVLLPDGAPWVAGWLDEVCGFTGKRGEINDRVDWFTLALSCLGKPSGSVGCLAGPARSSSAFGESSSAAFR